jgi:hypothetical protein
VAALVARTVAACPLGVPLIVAEGRQGELLKLKLDPDRLGRDRIVRERPCSDTHNQPAVLAHDGDRLRPRAAARPRAVLEHAIKRCAQP